MAQVIIDFDEYVSLLEIRDAVTKGFRIHAESYKGEMTYLFSPSESGELEKLANINRSLTTRIKDLEGKLEFNVEYARYRQNSRTE